MAEICLACSPDCIWVLAGANVASPLGMLFASNSLGNSFMAFNTNYHDTGLFGVYASTPKGRQRSGLRDRHPVIAWQSFGAVAGSCWFSCVRPC